VHQLAFQPARQIEIANEYISRIDSAIIVPVARLTVALAQAAVAAGRAVVRVLGEPAASPSDRY
jgi:hypothetical protein